MDGDDTGRHRTPAPAPPRRSSTRRRTALVVAGAVLGVLLVGYVADLLLTRGEVPRGTVVAGVAVGGLRRGEAEATLRERLGPRTSRPVTLHAGDVETTLDPAAAGLRIDWPATLDRAGDQPLNPITRVASLFGERTVEVVPTQDRSALTTALDAMRATIDRGPVEGAIRFDAATPVAIEPRPGQTLRLDRAVDVVAARWLDGATLEVPVDTSPVTVTHQGLSTALQRVARPASSTALVVPGRGRDAALPAADIGQVLRFEPDGEGGLRPVWDRDAATALLAPQLAPTETAPREADVVISAGAPQVLPGADGQRVDWGATLAAIDTVALGPAPHVLPAAYVVVRPALSTAAANRLGIREVIGEFTTGGFSPASGTNIRLAAAEIDNALVLPGETFSLNGYTGPRGTAQGYVESGIINNGRPDTAVGGGISQLATTLYNASYFAGMADVTHQEHSYYISRYPPGREATVFEGVIDLAFGNPAQTGVLIQTIGTGSEITVRLWGTKTVEVESINGGRFDYTSPSTVRLPVGGSCIETAGARGFTTTDTRVVRAVGTGVELSRRTTTTVYDPVPRVSCE